MIDDSHKTTYLAIDRQKIPIWQFGNAKYPKIFFIHGFPRPFSDMVGDSPIRYLMDHYCIYAFDLPGFGQSKQLSMDPLDFLSEMQLEVATKDPVILFGISFGGAVALQYAHRFPNRVKKIIIAGTPFPTVGFYSIRGLPILLHRGINRKIFMVGRHFQFLRTQSLRQMTIPTLLLYSKKDFVATPQMGQALSNRLQNAQLVVIDGYKHSWLLHRVDQNAFLPAIKEFLSQS